MSRGTGVRNRIKGLVAALVLTGAGLTVGLGSGVAAAQTGAPLPITSFGQIVADPANGYLFLSDPAQNQILVTNLAGQEVTTIGSQYGVIGMALSADGSTLYAALSTGNAVTAISTTTLAQTTSYPLPAGDNPVDVAVQSGDVWVSYGTTTVYGAIGDIDVSASSPAFATQANMGGWSGTPEIAADPEDSGVLVAVDPGDTPAAVASYDTAVDPATTTAASNFFTNCSNAADLAVVPGGTYFILACGSPYAQYEYTTASLSDHGSYASTNYPDAVAIDANGDVAAGTENGLTSNPDVYVYQQNGSTPANTFNLNSSGNLAPRGLAWAPDGSALFAVMAETSDTGGSTTYSLQVLPYPALTPSALALTGPGTALVNQPVTLTGSLTAAGSALAGATITVSRSEAGSTAVKDFTVTTATDGSFSLTDTPSATGQYTYTADYSGSTTVAPATASQTVTVSGNPTSLSVTASPATATYEPTVRVTAHLGTTSSNRTVSIYAETSGSSSRKLLTSGKVNSHGDLTLSYRAAHSTTFTADFAGDALYAPATATAAVSVRAKVTETLSGNSGSKHAGGQTYLVFHRKKTLDVHVTVAPDKAGECVEFTLAIYYQGAWHADTTSCGALSKASKLTIRVSLKKAGIGYHYRIRADYLPGSDTTNLGNDSAWVYFIVEK
jgi:hypothetical protein